MEYTYTILPMPKFDENQQQYLSHTYDAMYAMVPITAANTAMSGAVLEFLSYTAYQNVIPAYVKTSLQEKYTRDRESVQFIQLCFDGRRVDIAEVLMFDTFGDQVVYNLMIENDFKWISYMESKSGVIESAVKQYIELVHSGNNP